MSKTKDKTYSVKYVGNSDKRNNSALITRKGGTSIAIGEKGELTETEINNCRTAGLLLDVGREVKTQDDDSSSSSSAGSTAKTSSAS